MFQYKVSFIVPAQLMSESVNKTLDSIYLQEGDHSFEVIVVLGPHESVPSRENLKFLNAPLKSAAFARNQAISIAKGEYLAFVDSDTLLEQNWVSDLFSALDAGPWLGAQGRIMTSSRSKKGLFSEFRKLTSLLSQDTLILAHFPLPVLNTAACIYRNLEGLKFDEDLKAAEDIELSWRMLKSYTGGYFYTKNTSAISYYLPESFLKFYLRNLKLGLAIGSIIAQEGSYFRRYYLKMMRRNLKNEASEFWNQPKAAMIARLVASLITTVTCHLRISKERMHKSESILDRELYTFLINGKKIGNEIRISAIGSSVSFINRKSLERSSFSKYHFLSNNKKSYLFMPLESMEEK